MTQEFTDIRILDNFYQTSSFFPMPVVLVSHQPGALFPLLSLYRHRRRKSFHAVDGP